MKKIVSALTLAALTLMGSSQASASIVVDFTFDGAALEPGTVTGHLEFANAGVGVQATGVYIDSATSTVSGYQDYNFLNASRVTQNLFTVTADGDITSASLYLSSSYPYQNVATTWIQLNGFGGYNTFEQDYAQYYNGSYFRAISNQGGLSGATYAVPQMAIPEPAVWAMLITGFGLIGAAMRRRGIATAFA